MWCTNDVSFIFVVEWGGVGYRMRGDGGLEMGYEIEENKLARKRWEENGAKNRSIDYPLLRKAAFPWALSHFWAIRVASSRAWEIRGLVGTSSGV